MARPSRPKATPHRVTAASSSAAVQQFKSYGGARAERVRDDRPEIAKKWQIEAYRHVNICGEARYAATLFASLASRAELGISDAQSIVRRASWITEGPEVDALSVLAPTVRDRSRLLRDYMLHYVIAGECYLIARPRVATDIDPEDPEPIWEIVAVTELRKTGIGDSAIWSVRHDNNEYIELSAENPIIRMWNPDPSDRQEAWSPMRSMLATLREIEFLTKHIFTQVRSRLMSAGIWFLPDNLTFPPPPPEAVGGVEALAAMNEAEKFMASLALSGMQALDDEEVSFPSVVMGDSVALEAIDQKRLIKFWSEIDDKAMILRSDAVRRFALGMDLPPEQVLGSSGLAVTGAGGSAGSVNHWGVWANEEQTISTHVEPALDVFCGQLTTAYLQAVIPETALVIGFDTASLRLRQDRSKEAMEWYDRGILKAEVALRETGFDPSTDMMDDDEFRRWLLMRIAGGSATPEQVQASLELLGVVLNIELDSSEGPATRQPGRNNPPSLKDHPYEGPPRGDKNHKPAPFGAQEAAAEVLVLRALEKAGNRVLNDGKRGKDRDRNTPAHLAHVVNKVDEVPEFDFTLAATVYGDLPAAARREKERQLNDLCRDLYASGSPYTRKALIEKFGDQ